MTSEGKNALVPTGGRKGYPAELLELGKVYAQSGYFADARQVAQAQVKINAGRELGFGATASMTGIYLVKGRISLSAQLMMARLLLTKRYRYSVDKLDNKGCAITFYRRDEDDPKVWHKIGVSTFDENDAKLAQLLTGDNYRKFPRNMYFARAASNGCRWFAPDAFAGITPYTPDEISDSARMTDEDGGYEVSGDVEPLAVDVVDAEVVGDQHSRHKEALKLIHETKSDVNKILTYFGVPSIHKLDEKQLDELFELLHSI